MAHSISALLPRRKAQSATEAAFSEVKLTVLQAEHLVLIVTSSVQPKHVGIVVIPEKDDHNTTFSKMVSASTAFMFPKKSSILAAIQPTQNLSVMVLLLAKSFHIHNCALVSAIITGLELSTLKSLPTPQNFFSPK